MPSVRHRTRPLAVAAVAAVTAVLLGLSAAPASAHARLEASDPASGATVDTAPLEVVLRFNEDISADFAVVQVTTPSGARVDAETPAVAGDHVYTRLLPLGEPGAHTVAYRVVSADGHPVEGSFEFTLAEGAAAPQPEDPPAAAPQPEEPPAEAPADDPPAEDEGAGDEGARDEGAADDPADEPTEASTAAPAPTDPPTEEPTAASTELTAARSPGSSGIAPGVLVAAVVILVLLAGVGYAATRRRGGEEPTPPPADGSTPAGSA